MNKMYLVDVKPSAPWESKAAYIKAGSRKKAISIYLDMTGIGDEGDLGEDDIDCISCPDAPVQHTCFKREVT